MAETPSKSPEAEGSESKSEPTVPKISLPGEGLIAYIIGSLQGLINSTNSWKVLVLRIILMSFVLLEVMGGVTLWLVLFDTERLEKISNMIQGASPTGNSTIKTIPVLPITLKEAGPLIAALKGNFIDTDYIEGMGIVSLNEMGSSVIWVSHPKLLLLQNLHIDSPFAPSILTQTIEQFILHNLPYKVALKDLGMKSDSVMVLMPVTTVMKTRVVIRGYVFAYIPKTSYEEIPIDTFILNLAKTIHTAQDYQ